MQGTIAKLLIAASTVLFVVVSAACVSEKADGLPPYPNIEAIDDDAVMLYPRPAAFDIGAPTLEQVLDRTRSAMNEITSYRTRGASLDRDSTTEFSLPARDFSEQQSRDRYRFGLDSTEYEGGYFSESLTIGSRNFNRSDRETNLEWQESEPIFDRGEWVSPFDVILATFLNTDKPDPRIPDGFELISKLISRDEVTDDGIRVYRIEIIGHYDPPHVEGISSDGGRTFGLETRTTSLLIDKESYRLVAMSISSRYVSNFYDESSSEPPANIEWAETLYTERYYDYNEPIVVEVPDEYVPWSDDAVLSSVRGD